MSRAEDEKLVDQFEAMYRKSKGLHGRIANANPKLPREDRMTELHLETGGMG